MQSSHQFLTDPGANAQTVKRAIYLLRLVFEAGADGLRLRDATELTGWSKTTVHRLLCQLAEGGLLWRGPRKQYLLGRFAFDIGIATSPLGELRGLCHPVLKRLCARTGTTVFLGIRSGGSSLCVDYRLGNDVVPPQVPPRGALRPLGVGAAGLAVLSRLPDNEIDIIGEANTLRLKSYGVESRRNLAPLIEQARKVGYARVANIVVPGVVGIGACISDPLGHPLCSISAVAPVGFMTTYRERETAELIASEIADLRPAMLCNHEVMSLLRQ